MEKQMKKKTTDVVVGSIAKPKKAKGNVFGFSKELYDAKEKTRKIQEAVFNNAKVINVAFFRPEFKSNGDATKDTWAQFSAIVEVDGIRLNCKGTVFENHGKMKLQDNFQAMNRVKDGDKVTTYYNISPEADDLLFLVEQSDSISNVSFQNDTWEKKTDGGFSVMINKEKGYKFPAKDVGSNVVVPVITKLRDHFSKTTWDSEQIRLYVRRERTNPAVDDTSALPK